MHILLIDRNPKMIAAWHQQFQSGLEGVTILEADISSLTQVDAIVSPANSFGFMDGGIDNDISLRLGWELQFELQAKIRALPEGELLVGKAIVLPTADEFIPYLISAPTMRVPMSHGISTSVNAYLAMKAALLAAKAHQHIASIAVPGLCTSIGKMPHEVAALQMRIAFEEVMLDKKPSYASWREASSAHAGLIPNGSLFG